MSVRDQIFGYTPPGPTSGDDYVPYAMAFVDGDNIVIEVRNTECGVNSIRVPKAEAKKLASAIMEVTG